MSARIYTRTGDDGTTGLIGGDRVRKDDPRIESYGTVDELSSVLGLARVGLAEVDARLDAWLAWTQDVLFNLGAELATPPGARRPGVPAVRPEDTAALERAIDESQALLPPLTQFIHPGGSYPGGFLHQARTVARRAERLLVHLSTDREAHIPEETVRYLNRLSDALFVWSRRANQALGNEEHRWNPNAAPPPLASG